MTFNAWEICDDCSSNLKPIFEFLMHEYKRIFGEDIMMSEKCIVYNDSTSECPMIIYGNPLAIRLSQPKLSYWCQTIFQLSHELCHYALRYYKTDKYLTLSWFEEIVCEAMSLYALEFASKNWHLCEHSKSNPCFSVHINEYLNQQLSLECTDVLYKCTSIDLLIAYNSMAENDRSSHRNERNILYREISKCPSEVKRLCEYPNYVIPPENIAIDFDRWFIENPSDIVNVVSGFQHLPLEHSSVLIGE